MILKSTYYRILILFLTILVGKEVLSQSPQPVKVDSVVILFYQAPDSVKVTKTPLKYDKAFAMSFQEDDSHVDIYNTAYPLFEGNGTTGGLYYTDGCGNSLTFKMSTAMYIFNGLNVDLLEPGPYHVPDYLTWPQVKELWEHNWGVENHGVSDPVTGHADYDVQRTQSYAKRKVSDSLYIKVFVQPNQGEAYYVPSVNNNYNGFLGQGMADGLNGDESGIDLNDPTINWLTIKKVNRIFSGYGYKNKADELYGYSQQGSNRWVPWGWHINFTSAFSSELTQIYYDYGELGMDNILIASDDEILDYLAVKQAVLVNKNLSGNRLTITFSGNVPADRRFYSLTLKVKSNKIISNISVYGTDDYSVTGVNQDSGLINLSWDGRYYYPMEYLADSFTTVASVSGNQYDALVAMDYVILTDCGHTKDSLRDVLCGLNHEGWDPDYDDGFCDVLTVNLGNDTTILGGDCITLSGPDGDYSYSWSTGDTTQNLEICPETDTLVWLTIENNLGFCATDSINIFIHSFSFSLGPDTTICKGECVTLTGPDDMSYYHWYRSDTIFDTLQSTTVCPLDTTEYILEVMDSFGFITSDTIVINVLPVPDWSLGADTTINRGECDSIFGPDGFASYHWYRADTLFDTLQNVEVCPVDTTEYILIATTDLDCESSDTITYNVIHMEFSIGPDTSVCIGTDVTLSGPDNMDIYRWYENDTTNQIDTVQTITVSPEDTTQYILYAVDTIGAYNYDSIWINVIPLPDAFITYAKSVCNGDNSRIVVTPSLGYDKYIWHYNSIIDTSDIGVLVFTPIQTQTVTVEILDTYSCKTVDDTLVEVWPEPVLLAPDDSSACLGDSITFTADGDGKIWWEDMDGNIISDTTAFTTVSSADTTFIVMDTSSYGCLASDTVSLTVLPLPDVSIIYPDTAVCTYTEVELIGAGAENYTWFIGENQNTGDTLLFFISDTTTILVQGISSDGCSNTDSATINTKTVPEVLAWGLLPAYCQNDLPDTLYGTPEGGQFFGSGVVGNVFKPSIAGTGKQEVVYAIVNEESCPGYDTIFTRVYGAGNDIDLGTNDSIIPGDTIILDAGEGFDSYLWNTGDTTRTIRIVFNDYPIGLHRFSVVGIINSCTSTGYIDILFGDPAAVPENEIPGFIIYPNPSNGRFTLSYIGNGHGQQLFIVNLQGKTISSKLISKCSGKCTKTIKISGLTDGIYFVKRFDGIKWSFSKILIRE